MARKGTGRDANVKKLFRCISKGDFITAYELLKGGLTPEVADPSGFTAAGWAVFHSKSAIVKIMLEQGLNPNLTRGGISLLHLAASNGKALVAKMLLRAGANTATQDVQGRTPADLAKDDQTRHILTTPINELPAESEFDEGEQVFCMDAKGTRRPAEIVKRLPSNRFRVQFLGFTATEVEQDALTKVTSAEVERQLDFMQQAKEAKRQQQQQQRARARAVRASAAPAASEPVTPTTSGGPFVGGFPSADSDSVRSSRRDSAAAARGASAKRRVGTDLLTPPPAQRGAKAAKAGMAAADKESILSQLESVANSIAVIKDSVTSMSAPLPTFTSTAAATAVATAAAVAPADTSTTHLVAENQRLQETVEVLRAQQRESTEALATSPVMTSSFAGKDEADKIKVIAELRTKCIQLEAERDRYKRLMELNAAKYATQQAEAVATAAAEAAAAERKRQQQQRQQQGQEGQEGLEDKVHGERQESEGRKEAEPAEGAAKPQEESAGDEGAADAASTKQENGGVGHSADSDQQEQRQKAVEKEKEEAQEGGEEQGDAGGVKQEQESPIATAKADAATSGGSSAMDTGADDEADANKEEASPEAKSDKPDEQQKDSFGRVATTAPTAATSTVAAVAARSEQDTTQASAESGAHPNPEPLTAATDTSSATVAE